MSQSSKRCSRKIKQAIVLVEFILRQEKQKNDRQNGSRTVFQHYIPVVKEIHWASKWHVYFLFIRRQESIDMFLVLGLACWCPQYKPHSIVRD